MDLNSCKYQEYLTSRFSRAKVEKCKVQYSFVNDPDGKQYIREFRGMTLWHKWLNDPSNNDKVVHQLLIRYSYD